MRGAYAGEQSASRRRQIPSPTPFFISLKENIGSVPKSHDKKDAITDYDPMYNQLGKTDALRQRNYREHIQDGLEKINLNMRFLGPADYISEMVKEFKIPNLRGKKGRPKNENK